MNAGRVTGIAFRLMSGFALLAMLVGVGEIGWNLYFAFTAEVRPGEFEYYRTVRTASRSKDSSGRYYTSYAEESRPVYRYLAGDGSAVEVEGTQAHVIPYLDPGDAIEVLVDPAGEREPMIRGIVPIAANGVVLALVGGLFLAFAEFARRMAMSLLAAGARQEAHRRRRAASSREAVVDEVVLRRRGGCRRVLVVGVVLWAAVLGLAWWLTVPDTADAPGESAATQQPPPETGTARTDEVEAPAEPPASRPARAERPPLETAARSGDAVEMARLLDAGADVGDLPLAVVKTLVRKEDVASLRVLFEHGFDLSQRYARQTFGDQAVSQRSTAVVRLVQAFGGEFDAPPEFVALVAGDVEALAAALAAAPPERQWRGVRIDHFARHPDAKALLAAARAR